MNLHLSVRIGDAVARSESSVPLTADGDIHRVYVLFMPADPDVDHRSAAFLESMRAMLYRGRIQIIINKDLHLETAFVYEVPLPGALVPDRPMRTPIDGGERREWRVRRGDTMKLVVELDGDVPKKPVVLRAVFDIEEAPTPPLN